MLPDASCPLCGRQMLRHDIVAAEQTPITAGFSDCLRQCESCGVGLSNAKTGATLIYKDPLNNVPSEAHDGALNVLGNALNQINRENKLAKFGFQTSEDAISWTVFSFLARSRQFSQTLVKLLGGNEQEEPILLLWGVPFPGSESGKDLRKRLLRISDELGERPNSRSEPDVLLRHPDGSIVVLEVKYRSENDVKSSTHYGWSRGYLRECTFFRDPLLTRDSGLYELARNWRIAGELAAGEPFTLVNLCFQRNERADALERMKKFKDSINTSSRARFEVKLWSDLLVAIPDKPNWLVQYLAEKSIH